MMKKTIFIGTAIAACLILAACSKKEQHEAPPTDNQTTSESQTPVAKNPASEPLQPMTTPATPASEPFQGLSKDEASSIMAEPAAAKPAEKPHRKHHTEHQESTEKVATTEANNTDTTTTHVHREVKEIPSTPSADVKVEKVAATETVKPKKANAHLSEDDAVAAAMAAAKPALKN
ncbi:hypothetical protein I2F27_05125 [Acinetobacter sp. B5B]|uniref:hypothetical protein n=1 Tax=Acinetobacter baretiae TaxID=2605383 RepID=UPI0018C29427|nr:hypothetical protein [Acinetobacter baretiae]MBF7682716.1 hypothetical protein [Acinetobacter baretiae]